MNTIYGRKTIVKAIVNEIAQSFINENHRQKSIKLKNKNINIGLFEESTQKLIGVAQFGSPRTAAKQREYSTELLRMCFKNNLRVIGGASKLIKYFINEYNPTDIFTYQSRLGENTDVYKHCGFNLIKQEKYKEFLVKNGKTIDTAEKDKQEIYTLSYVVKLGPDKILGTNIGENFNEDGSRKTNIQLFEKLGYHVEKNIGDNIYEWFNPNISFYTYKITSTDSNKYYYGVRSIKIPFENIIMEDCLKDDYYGSGGLKFQSWKKKYFLSLKKDIIQIFNKKTLAYQAEKKLIGDSWKADPLCLNSTNGGNAGARVNGNGISIAMCEIHKETKHKGNKCYKCTSDNSVFEKECSIHGLTKHRGNACYKCFMNDLVTVQVCEIHGETKFQGESCSKCAVGKTFTKKICPKHGETTFSGVHCRKCSVEKTVQMKECSIHGLTKHQGDVCNSCNALSSISLKVCEVHGETKFTGERCRKCISAKNNVKKECPIHGLSSHRGKSCVTCTSQKTAHKKYHLNNKNLDCFVCQNEDSIINPVV